MFQYESSLILTISLNENKDRNVQFTNNIKDQQA